MQSFKPSTEMTFATADLDYNRFVTYLKYIKKQDLVFDLEGVTRCDSAGLALLIVAKRESILANKQCYFKDVNESIRSLAELCGVADLIDGKSQPEEFREFNCD